MSIEFLELDIALLDSSPLITYGPETHAHTVCTNCLYPDQEIKMRHIKCQKEQITINANKVVENVLENKRNCRSKEGNFESENQQDWRLLSACCCAGCQVTPSGFCGVHDETMTIDDEEAKGS